MYDDDSVMVGMCIVTALVLTGGLAWVLYTVWTLRKRPPPVLPLPLTPRPPALALDVRENRDVSFYDTSFVSMPVPAHDDGGCAHDCGADGGCCGTH